MLAERKEKHTKSKAVEQKEIIHHEKSTLSHFISLQDGRNAGMETVAEATVFSFIFILYTIISYT